jgi:hypothetical protein
MLEPQRQRGVLYQALAALSSHERGGIMAIFVCTWNDGDIVETHTRQSLEVEYASTNLFDIDESYVGSESWSGCACCAMKVYVHFNDGEYNDFGILLEALESDDVYIGHEFARENMTIRRVR